MDDPVEPGAGLRIAEHHLRQGGPVQRPVGGDHPVPECLDDGGQPRGSRFDHLAGDHVGVDDHRPTSARSRETVLFPDPIPPVSPMRSTPGQ